MSDDATLERGPRRRAWLSAPAWRARVLLAAGLLLAPLGARVIELRLAWASVGACQILAAEVRRSGDGHVPWLQVQVDGPETCLVGVEAAAPAQARDDVERRLAAFPVGASIPCHRVPGVCGAAFEQPTLDGWLVVPLLALGLVAAGARGLVRERRGQRKTRAESPFRAPPAREPAPPLEVRLAGDGWLAKVLVVPLFVAPGLLGAPAMLYVLWSLPLHEPGFALVVLAMLAITGALLVGGLSVLWPRRRFVVSREHAAAFRAWGVGPLDLRRTYGTFERAPDVAVRPRSTRGSRITIFEHDVVLSDGAAELCAATFARADEAEALAARLRDYLVE